MVNVMVIHGAQAVYLLDEASQLNLEVGGQR